MATRQHICVLDSIESINIISHPTLSDVVRAVIKPINEGDPNTSLIDLVIYTRDHVWNGTHYPAVPWDKSLIVVDKQEFGNRLFEQVVGVNKGVDWDDHRQASIRLPNDMLDKKLWLELWRPYDCTGPMDTHMDHSVATRIQRQTDFFVLSSRLSVCFYILHFGARKAEKK